MPAFIRWLLAFVVCPFALGPAPAAGDVLDLERLDGPALIAMMEAGTLTSVRLTKAYIDRIEALNKRGPGLNAVTQLNQDALEEAELMDKERAQGIVRGPAHGLPVLLKDLIDVKGMYTSNGNYSLRESFPEDDSGIVKKLRASGVVILGKLGLSEYANSFGNQPSGFSNLTGQVVHALDADQNPSGSSSGSGAAGAAALAALIVGTETSGSIISPSTAQSLVGIRPTVGLVPAYGIGPISSSQDTAGPMDRTVATAAMHLQSMAGRDPKNEAGYEEVFGPNWEDSVTRAPDPLPDYMSALDPSFVQGKRIGYNRNFDPGSQAEIAFNLAYDALVAGGAIMVERPQIAVASIPSLPSGYQQHNAINLYYRNLGPLAPIKSLLEEIADNQANAHEALKFGHNSHLNASMAEVEVGGPNQLAYQAAMPVRRAAQRAAINSMMNNETPDDPSDDFIAILGGVPSGAAAGTPQITIPLGYTTTHRRAFAISIHGNQLSERDLIGVAYVIEQGTKLRQPASELNPSMYRCAKTVPLPPYHERGSCNPDYKSLAKFLPEPELPFTLEMESVESLQARMIAGTLTSRDLTKAYLIRIARTNAEGPAIQAVRTVQPLRALRVASRMDGLRKRGEFLGPLHGIPVLLADVIDVRRMPTTGGSIALQEAVAKKHATLVAKLEEAGAVILGKTNVTELNGLFDSNLPEGYSSLGGQVMLPSDTDKTTAGSSAGSAAATAAGLAALAIGLETSTDAAQLIAPAGVAGVIGLKPTVGLVSRAGVLPAAKSQDSPGPITRTVYDAAAALEAMAGPDPADDATAAAPESPDYLSGLLPTALAGKRVAVIDSTTAPYPTVVAALQALGATTVVTTIPTPSPDPPSIVLREFERDLDAYLPTLRIRKGSPSSLQEIVAYNDANPVEGLKYQQRELLDALAVDLSDPATAAAYESDKTSGLASSRAVIDAILTGGTEDTADDVEVIVVPNNNALVGIADRAGYPILTVPAGYGTGNQGRNPIGVAFVAAAFDEARLLAAGYAFEQATNVRQAPSFTNPSMWRCVTGSTFFSPHHCHPGDLLASS
jgi:Asp-tRNA(Asn)/Glu-tRNA(Gln) amidotransferase A subunit family amidase